MTHAELRAQLRAYADGTLAEREAELVRAHLAGGCLACLGEVFERPVGLPRPRPLEVTTPAVIPRVIRRRRRSRWPAVTGGIAMAAAVLAAVVSRERGREPDSDAPARAAAERMRAERDALAAELERVDRERARPDDADPVPTPAPGAPPAETDAVPRWLGELLGAGGTTVAALEPAPLAQAAHGYVVWSPERNLVVVSAVDLPPAGEDGYRLRIEMGDGTVLWVGQLTASPRGAMTMTLALPGAAGRRVVAVDVYRDPPGAPALTARLKRTS